MGNLRNILVVIEIKQLRQPALERGIALDPNAGSFAVIKTKVL